MACKDGLQKSGFGLPKPCRFLQTVAPQVPLSITQFPVPAGGLPQTPLLRNNRWPVKMVSKSLALGCPNHADFCSKDTPSVIKLKHQKIKVHFKETLEGGNRVSLLPSVNFPTGICWCNRSVGSECQSECVPSTGLGTMWMK